MSSTSDAAAAKVSAAVAQTCANLAEDAADRAIAAASSAAGSPLQFDTYEDFITAAPGGPRLVIVTSDETKSGAISLYVVTKDDSLLWVAATLN